MKHLLLLLMAFFTMNASFSQANDAIKIAEARVALDKNDCKIALEALDEVSEEGKKTALFKLYCGKAHDCAKDYDNAMTYYEAYIQMNPNASDIIQRIAELRYEQKKKEKKYDLEGLWQAKDDPGKLRTLEQSGDHIKLFDQDEEEDVGIKFEGELQPNAVFKGGRYWYFKKGYTFSNSEDCKKCYFGDMEYKDEDERFRKETEQDILTVSSDGNTITVRMQTPSVQCSSTRITLWEDEKVYYTYLCRIVWETKYHQYIRVKE